MLFLRHLRFCAAPPTAGDPSGFLPFSGRVCLPCWWRRLGLPPFPCVLSASPTPAGFCSLCQGAPIAVVAALCMAVWWCLMAPRAFRALLVVLPSPPVVLCLCGCCALFTVWFPLPLGGCASGLRCLQRKLAARFVQSRLPFVVSPPSDVSVCPSPALAGQVVWSQSFGPSCCALVGSLMRHSVTLAYCHALSFCCFSPGFLPLAFVPAWVGRLWSCLGSSLIFFGGALLPLSLLFSLGGSNCFVVQAP